MRITDAQGGKKLTPQKLTGFHKFVSFVMVAILLILVIGFAVNGWQANDNLPDSGDVGNKTDDTDENSDKNGTENETDTPPNENNNNENNSPPVESPPAIEPEPIIYLSSITGLEISESRYNTVPVGTVLNPRAPLYGVSDSEIAIELPIEDGSSRLLVYTTDEDVLWKIGALAPTRSYISEMSGYFGGILVSYGKDDSINPRPSEYNAKTLDLSLYSDCYYIENSHYVYTSENMIELAKTKKAEAQFDVFYKSAPFDFCEDTSFRGTAAASTVIIPYSDQNETELYYHESSGKYLYYKSANRKMDMLTGENVSYKNVFILFADSTTYEKAEGSELVMDVAAGGKGYYASEGTYTEFIWSTDVSGALNFYTLSGEKLMVNPGNSYISYYKSSALSKVTII